jgi:branched-chain amino acid transport system substrate-binding protein
MTTRALAAAAAAALALAASGCGGGGAPVRIGVLVDCQGPLKSAQEAELSAAELPLLRRGARLVGPAPSDGTTPATVGGRKVELVRGCSETGEEAVFIDEARRLVEEEHVDAVIGGASVVPRELARRYPDVPFLDTSWEQEVTLRRPAPNLYRFTLDFGQWAAGLGAYAYDKLGWRRATILAGNDPPGWGAAAAFVAEFCALGGKVDREVYRSPFVPEPNRKLASRVLAAKADGVASFLTDILDSSTAVVGALLKRLDHPRDHLLLWSPQLEDSAFLPTLGAKLDGVVLTSRYPAGRPSKALTDYEAAYRAAFPRMPRELARMSFIIDYADSVEALLTALDHADGDLTHGRSRLRAELARLRVALPRGDVHLDANRQAVGDVPLVRLHLRHGEAIPDPVGMSRNVEQTFGGLLSHAPPPGPYSQPCRKATPPPWAARAVSRRSSR